MSFYLLCAVKETFDTPLGFVLEDIFVVDRFLCVQNCTNGGELWQYAQSLLNSVIT